MRKFLRASTPRSTEPKDLSFDAGAWPQVGAVLQHLDSAGPRPLDWNGSPRWDADGSAVLIAPRHALTIRHVTANEVDEEGRVAITGAAVFFPSVGLVPVDHGQMVVRGEEDRDRLLVLQLTREVPLPPIPASMVDLDDVRHPQAVGFGDWVQPNGTVYHRGVQRRLTPDLGAKLCTHDLCWDAQKDGTLAAGLNNSGGPIIERRPNGYQVVGVMRRQRDDIMPGRDVIAATAVSRNRAGALYRTIYRVFGEVERPLEPPPVVWEDDIEINRSLLRSFTVPPGTSMVYATLSVARQWVGEVLLQMRLLPGRREDLGAGVEPMILDGLARDLVSTGEFLARSLRLEAPMVHVSVAIAPTAPLAGRLRAQLCLRFVGARPQLLGMVSTPGIPVAVEAPVPA